MILGRGTAASDDAIFAEYVQFLDRHSAIQTSEVQGYVRSAPLVMRRRIAKPVAQWSEADLLAIFATRTKATIYYYGTFVAFLIFRGYFRPSLAFLTTLPVDL